VHCGGVDLLLDSRQAAAQPMALSQEAVHRGICLILIKYIYTKFLGNKTT